MVGIPAYSFMCQYKHNTLIRKYNMVCNCVSIVLSFLLFVLYTSSFRHLVSASHIPWRIFPTKPKRQNSPPLPNNPTPYFFSQEVQGSRWEETEILVCFVHRQGVCSSYGIKLSLQWLWPWKREKWETRGIRQPTSKRDLSRWFQIQDIPTSLKMTDTSSTKLFQNEHAV